MNEQLSIENYIKNTNVSPADTSMEAGSDIVSFATVSNPLKQAREQLVVRSNDMIQNTRYHLSRTENCILHYLISKVKPNDPISTEYIFSMDEFSHLMRYKTDSFTDLKATVKQLADKSFWYVPKNNPDKPKLIRWFNRVEANNKEKIFRISFHQDVAPFIFQLWQRNKLYSGQKLSYVLMLGNYYSQQLYAILCSYSNNPVYYFELGTGTSKDLYRMLCDGPTHNGVIPKNWLENFGYFRKRVLDPACQEINQYTDLDISYEPTKVDAHMARHRSFCRVIFSIRKRTEREISSLDKRIDTIYTEYDADYARRVFKKQRTGIEQLKKDAEAVLARQNEQTFIENAILPEDVGVIEESIECNSDIQEERLLPALPDPISLPAQTQTTEPDDLIRGMDGDLRYVSDVCNLHLNTISELKYRLPELTDKQVALYILEAERHIGPHVDPTYKESWIRDYLTFYVDSLMRSSTLTRSTLDNRLWDNYVKDYQKYANILNQKYIMRSHDAVSATLNKYKQNNGSYIDINRKDGFYTEAIDFIENQSRKQV